MFPFALPDVATERLETTYPASSSSALKRVSGGFLDRH